MFALQENSHLSCHLSYQSGDCHCNGSSFLQGTRLVYEHLASLYFVFVFDGCENELPMLDLSQGANQASNLEIISL